MIGLRGIKSWIVTVLLLSASMPASAVLVEFEQANLGGNRFENTYTVTNDDLAGGVEGLSIWFEFDAYENIEITDSPLDWDPLVFPPEPPFFLDGLADWLALGLPLALGETLSGFKVAFDWIGLGPAPYDTQFFDVYDPFTFSPLASGTAQKAVSSVSAPGLASIWFLILCGLIVKRKASRRI